ncbi:hypothetical protein [Fontivita pretiosa]|uniref:hypothetical protein n=1 Tax=Fontivita pretiosa TaxID=2989684 RepID=UPI003D17B034
MFTSLLAQWRPFLTPMPIYDYWYWLLLPLCLIFSIVYKSVKCEDVRQIPRAALGITIWILLGMGAAALVLTLVVRILE